MNSNSGNPQSALRAMTACEFADWVEPSMPILLLRPKTSARFP